MLSLAGSLVRMVKKGFSLHRFNQKGISGVIEIFLREGGYIKIRSDESFRNGASVNDEINFE